MKTKRISATIMIGMIFALVCLQLNLGRGFDMPSPVWRTKTAMPSARAQAAVVTGDDGLIYVMGGWAGMNPPTIAVEAYDPVMEKWTTKASMLYGVRGAAAAKGVDGTIYVISGADVAGKAAYVQAYNTTSDTWSAKSSIPVQTWMAPAAAGNDGKIYVFGGESKGSLFYSNLTQVYDPVSDTWANSTDMPTARRGTAAVKGSDGLIYVIGGNNGSSMSVVEAFNPSTETWTKKQSMPSAKAQFGAALGPDGKIYVFGGGLSTTNNDPPFLDTVEVYDMRSGEWSIPSWSESALPTARKEFSAALGKNGRIYAIGGAAGGYLNVNEEATIQMPENVPPTAYVDSVSPNPATAGDAVILVGHGSDADGSIVAYNWRSSINGTLGSTATLNISTLTTGTHNIYFSVKDNSGAWSQEATAILTVQVPTSEDPLYQRMQDLNSKVNDLQQKNTELNDTLNGLSRKLDTMTWEILGASVVIIILVAVIVAVLFIPPRRKAPPS